MIYERTTQQPRFVKDERTFRYVTLVSRITVLDHTASNTSVDILCTEIENGKVILQTTKPIPIPRRALERMLESYEVIDEAHH
jgi:hypothetical protein